MGAVLAVAILKPRTTCGNAPFYLARHATIGGRVQVFFRMKRSGGSVKSVSLIYLNRGHYK